VILAGGIDASLAAKAATKTIPVVFLSAADPVAMGLVASLDRPGANLTGSAILQAELAPKQMQLLHELRPNAALFGVLADPVSPTTQFISKDLQATAPALGLQVLVVNADG
jgi:putative tryptophan/tyrosine transport system substrate-binding protein